MNALEIVIVSVMPVLVTWIHSGAWWLQRFENGYSTGGVPEAMICGCFWGFLFPLWWIAMAIIAVRDGHLIPRWMTS